MSRAARILCTLILLMGPVGLRGVHACGDHGGAAIHDCGHHAHGGDADHGHEDGSEQAPPQDDCQGCDLLAQQHVGSMNGVPLLVPAPRPVPLQEPGSLSPPRPCPVRETLAQPPPAV